MYTNMSTARHALRLGLLAMLPAIGFPSLATAQDPPPLTKIRGVTITATPLPPGPNIMVGVVRDTAGIPIPGAEVIIPDLRLRLITNGEGIFRFDNVRKGKHTMRARKIGFTPQIREFRVDTAGGVAEFALVPVTTSLAPVIAWSDRPGISGVVGDTSFQPIPGAVVRLLGGGLETETDSSGRFYLPARGGSHVLRITKPGYDYKLVSVAFPRDSGRRVTAWLNDVTHLPTVREVHNMDDLRERIAWTKPQHRVLFTHDQLETVGSEWAYDAIATASSRFNAKEAYSRDCMVVVNGGPSITNLKYLTVDEIESIEIYGAASAPAMPTPVRRATRGPTSLANPGRGTIATPSSSMSNTNRAAMENGTRNCPTMYVWLR